MHIVKPCSTIVSLTSCFSFRFYDQHMRCLCQNHVSRENTSLTHPYNQNTDIASYYYTQADRRPYTMRYYIVTTILLSRVWCIRIIPHITEACFNVWISKKKKIILKKLKKKFLFLTFV